MWSCPTRSNRRITAGSTPPQLTRRVLAVAVPTCAAGAAAIAFAAATYARIPHSATDIASLVALFLGAALAERFPVPLEGIDSGGVTLGFVFAVSTIVLFGWQAGVLVAAAGPTVAHLLNRRPPLRIAYNASMFALSALAGGLAIEPLHSQSIGALIVRIALCALVYNWIVNLVLLSAVVAADSRRPFFTLVWTNLRQTTAAFALQASAALMLVVLWQRSAALSLALVGPLVAIALYQRSTFAALKAMTLALTDPLTGLGNHRNFHERLQRELALAEQERAEISLCLVDVDDFKTVNDRFGHPVGDRVLGQIAARLRHGGESFRLGGDEFAILLPGLDDHAAIDVARSIVERVGTATFEEVGTITVSAGVATYPLQGVGRDELIRVADSALYWAKESGKNRARVYEPTRTGVVELRQLATSRDDAARYEAAASLAKAVDVRTGRQSERVGELAARIARRLGVDEPLVELTRLAGSLHDVGKLAIPEEILRKPDALNDSERLVIQRHPQIGHRILEGLGVEPVADWVLHHHERWDGAGYPDRLRGDEIPLGARIIFVADAYDAMTSERVYQKPLSKHDALAELANCAGTQFDPKIVDAFADEIRLERVAVA